MRILVMRFLLMRLFKRFRQNSTYAIFPHKYSTYAIFLHKQNHYVVNKQLKYCKVYIVLCIRHSKVKFTLIFYFIYVQAIIRYQDLLILVMRFSTYASFPKSQNAHIQRTPCTYFSYLICKFITQICFDTNLNTNLAIRWYCSIICILAKT